MPETPDLAAAARSHTVGIVGGGLGGLIVAWECAKLGMSVSLWDAAEVGGMARTGEVHGVSVDIAADSFERSAEIDEVLSSFGLTDEIVESAAPQRWLLRQTPIALPASAALGIPANPFSTDVTAVIGWGAAWRAYLDRLKPVLTIGNAENLGELVRQRLGTKVRDTLVAPHTRAELRLDPDDVLIDVALPELNGALTRAGSLSGGVGLLDDDATTHSLAGGFGRLVTALRDRIKELGGTVHEHRPVTGVRTTDDGWKVTLAPDADDEVSEATVQHLVLATDARAAHTLLVPLLPSLPEPVVTEHTVVTAIASGTMAQRGGALYAADKNSAVQRIDHVTAEWPDVSRPAEHEVIRVTLAGALADEAAADQARAAILAAYGAKVVAMRVERFARSRVRAARGQAEHVAAVRAQIATLHQVDAVGAWVAGDSVHDVVTDAMVTAEAIRRHALFPG